MLDAALAGSAPPASTLGPRTETEPPRAGVELLCTPSDHSYLKELIAEHNRVLSFSTAEYEEWRASLDHVDIRRLESWLESSRAWPGTTLRLGECVCHSSITICGDCNGAEMVEDTRGREVSCDCVREDVEWARGGRTVAAFDHFFAEQASRTGGR